MNAYTHFEIKACAFYRMTGIMAPGKDEPAASGGHPMGERIDAWDKWNTDNHDLIAALLWAVERELEDEL